MFTPLGGSHFGVQIEELRLNQMEEAVGKRFGTDHQGERDLSKRRLSKFESISAETVVSKI